MYFSLLISQLSQPSKLQYVWIFPIRGSIEICWESSWSRQCALGVDLWWVARQSCQVDQVSSDRADHEDSQHISIDPRIHSRIFPSCCTISLKHSRQKVFIQRLKVDVICTNFHVSPEKQGIPRKTGQNSFARVASKPPHCCTLFSRSSSQWSAAVVPPREILGQIRSLAGLFPLLII